MCTLLKLPLEGLKDQLRFPVSRGRGLLLIGLFAFLMVNIIQ